MSTFQFLFSCYLGKITLKQTNNLSKSLQNPSISAAQGQEIPHPVIETLSKIQVMKNLNYFGLI